MRWLLLALTFPLLATNYTVKPSGGNYTTVQACATAMAAGDTCTVFAGTYPETVTVSAGSTGSPKTLTVNSGDTAIVRGFIINSYVTINGFEITGNVAVDCVLLVAGSTQYTVSNNYMHSCGVGVHEPWGSTATSYGHIFNNRIAWLCATPPAPSAVGGGCTGIMINGDHHLVENNDLTHVSDGASFFGDFNVFRGNTMHDTSDQDWQTPATNTHVDFVESECADPGQLPAHYYLYEGNTLLRNLGSNAHSFLFQVGCSAGSHNAIVRFNSFAHIGSNPASNGYSILDQYYEGNGTVGFYNVKLYNNTTVDTGVRFDRTDLFMAKSTGGAEINNIFYYPGSMSTAPYAVAPDSTSGFSGGSNLAFCGGTCGFSGLITTDPGNMWTVGPQFADYASDDFHLQSTSPSRGAGRALTTVAAGDAGSGTTLVVSDAGFFQDGLGLTAFGVQSDWIRIGSTNTVQISSVSYATNTITLASGVSRSTGDAVYLYKNSSGSVVLNGANPDIGAYQYSSGGTITTITTTSPLAPGTVGTAYSVQFAATGDTPITWTATGVPAGLTLSSAGLLSGTPTTAAVNTINVTATNAAGPQSGAPTAFSLTITAAVPSGNFTGIYSGIRR